MTSRQSGKGSSSARFVKNTTNDRQNNQPERNYNNFSNDKFNSNNSTNNNNNNNSSSYYATSSSNLKSKLDLVKEIDRIDSVFGFDRYESGPKKIGWLVNMHATTIPTADSLAGASGVDYHFLDEEGGSFKATVKYDPYFLLACQSSETEVEEYLRKFLEGSLRKISRVSKEDLELPNHLIGLKRQLLKLEFRNITDLLDARRLLQPIIEANKASKDSKDIYKSVDLNYNTYLKESNTNDDIYNDDDIQQNGSSKLKNVSELIEDIREYDVPYHVRVSIDKNIRVGKWYTVEADQDEVTLTEIKDKIAFADPVVLAFDIETTKAPLKFPDSAVDQIMMISYMIDGEGFLITNRDIISEDIDDFEYTPKPEYPGMFTIFNEPDEKALIEKFFEHIRDSQPTVIATFNGDFFDWPFVEARALYHDIDMFQEIGFAKDAEGEYKSNYCVHMDCYRWVKRDSYLPQGSQGLKAVTTAKLGYNPTELDPELMTPYAYEKPQLLSEYSVSDAVATYYLYYKYVHPFIFSLCTIIPLNPDEVLRKGTGTLCEMLLMVQAYQGDILLPNKHTDPLERFYDGHLLESETYVGGHVESLEAGVFRADLETHFNVDPTAIDEIIADLDNSLKFSIVVEAQKKLEDVTNYDEIYNQIKEKLLELKEKPKRQEPPLIYHVDVASMYPNIMTTNRLQPDSMKSEKDCASCDFNRPGKNCDRRLPWAWRGEFYPAEMNEYNMIKNAAHNETFPPRKPGMPRRTFDELSAADQAAHLKKKISDYSRKVYHRIKQTETVEREAIICQRENPFYVDTVRDFRDRRYEFKGLAKVWKGKASQVKDDKNALDEAKKMVVLYDSLQLAHKVILNSFYGYVMRKGSRWYSMEMAGITCLTGATIIQMARSLVERLGRPLELDTDGIWCILPSSFPENYNFELKNGKKIFTSYPCSMLNYLVHDKFTNHQYQKLVDPVKLKYETHSDNSIFFEVDGPYKAMVLPTSKEEGKGLKKRYAVFNFDGSIAELKGFELKRRGELQLIKNFQSDIFKLFLDGDSLEGCYQSVANVANRWLDVLDTKGSMLEDEDLIELICENRSMSKTLEEYGKQKSTSITTAKRLGEFLGEEMVKDKGLACKYIIADRPLNSPTTERAIPTAIFSAELSVKRKYLRRWLGDPTLETFDPRSIINWEYYRERLASVIQKIITIPAALQGVSNPVPRIKHPEWLQRTIDIKDDKLKQTSLTRFFSKAPKGSNPRVMTDVTNKIQDIEDFGIVGAGDGSGPKISKVTSRKRKLTAKETEDEANQIIMNQPCPDPLTDYEAFLSYQKIKWGMQAKERARRKNLFGDSFQTTDRSAIGTMRRQKAESFATSTWEVIQYAADPAHPGDLKVFVLIDGKIQSLTFHIPKKVYLSFKAADFMPTGEIPHCKITKALESLPNKSENQNLYKLVLPEQSFIDESAKAHGLFKNENVSGLYESNIEATERAILELGSCVKFNQDELGALGKALDKGFDQETLRAVPSENYLKRFSAGILYLLHIVSNSYELFALFNSQESIVEVFVLKPSASAQPLSSNVSSVYKELYNAKKDNISKYYNIIDYQSEMEFNTQYFTDISKLYKKLNAHISKVADQSASKMLFTIQSPFSSKLSKILTSTASLPSLMMNIGEISLNSLSWQSLIMKRVINHYLSLASWLKKMISLAKYGNIPLCNLKVDDMGYLIDIEYARRLNRSNIVLWWSPNPTPDYGGIEKDRFVLSGEESLEFPNINRPEIYETVCLELDIKNLTINTMLTSALINDAEGVFTSESGDNGNAQELSSNGTFAEDAFSAPALIVLRGLIKSWWDDAIKDNPDADSMIHSFVSWCQNPKSFLYDSSLHYHVHNLTKKSLVQLLGEFKRMGSSVVFADRNRVILKTSKTVVENSYAYGQYITSTARSSPLFNYLELNVVRYWDLLIWMDKYNYAGRFCYEISETEVQELEAVSKWQIGSFLPPILREEFADWAVLFLDSLVKFREEENKHSSQTQGSPRKTQITQILKNNKFIKDLSAEAADTDINYENGVCEMFRNPLIKRMKNLLRKQMEMSLNSSMAEEYMFPILPGSHLKMSNPTLELVKYLCHILSLSKTRNIEVRILRRDLLSLFDVKEFSDEGLFKNPSTSLILPQIICGYCNFIKDIDVCKDDEHHIWNCEGCDKPYNKLVIEEKLIYEFSKTIGLYMTQDLKCSKCSRIKDNEISTHCACSGSWVGTINKKDVIKICEVNRNVADAYQLNLLRDITDELLG
ncbi:hypothetical protein CANARDRAFT_220740 [[Candida] arabinofermentans NRRL YB-2248]|uniref:DNA polymerase epsilon catalytic subunit n=1 Tax=[Candida] arabinofermentans NRRL YB-2248 TaxID=983967 RepID=A0A1E4T2L5_9ASCO|nr:hypothetical protein CANARDRAFT_220740 [[Candida] arabinofermentans NRRL YB-2248]